MKDRIHSGRTKAKLKICKNDGGFQKDIDEPVAVLMDKVFRTSGLYESLAR